MLMTHFQCRLETNLWGNWKGTLPVYDKKLRKIFSRLPMRPNSPHKSPEKRFSVFHTARLSFFEESSKNTKFGKKTEYRSGERRFRYRKINFCARIIAFWGDYSEQVPRFWTALFSKNAVYVSKSAHKFEKPRSELTETNRSPTVRNGEFRRKLAPETSRRAQRRILRGEFSGVLFFAQPSNWGGISEKKKSAINRSHGAGLRKNGGADGSWTHDLYDANVSL